MRMIQSETDEKHGQPPSNRSEHPLPAVLIRVLRSQKVEYSRVRQGHRGAAEELSNDDQQKEEEENFSYVVQIEDGVGESRRNPLTIHRSFVVHCELQSVPFKRINHKRTQM